MAVGGRSYAALRHAVKPSVVHKKAMYETPNKVLETARQLQLGSGVFEQVGPTQWEAVLKSVFLKFGNTSETGVTWFWKQLKNQGVSVQTENGLDYISTIFKPETKVWVLFEDWDRTKKKGNYWVFEGNYGSTVEVLNNMHGIEYYIVDRTLNWMIMENHHDILIAVGEPAESLLLELKLAQQGTPPDAYNGAAEF